MNPLTSEQWSPTLFLVGGVLLIGHAVISGLHALIDMATPQHQSSPSPRSDTTVSTNAVIPSTRVTGITHDFTVMSSGFS